MLLLWRNALLAHITYASCRPRHAIMSFFFATAAKACFYWTSCRISRACRTWLQAWQRAGVFFFFIWFCLQVTFFAQFVFMPCGGMLMIPSIVFSTFHAYCPTSPPFFQFLLASFPVHLSGSSFPIFFFGIHLLVRLQLFMGFFMDGFFRCLPISQWVPFQVPWNGCTRSWDSRGGCRQGIDNLLVFWPHWSEVQRAPWAEARAFFALAVSLVARVTLFSRSFCHHCSHS